MPAGSAVAGSSCPSNSRQPPSRSSHVALLYDRESHVGMKADSSHSRTRSYDVDASSVSLGHNVAEPKLIVVCSRLATRPRRALETDFRLPDLASTGPYCMNAAFMRLGRHERGIHVVSLASAAP
jgi:hypothetical protein